MIARQERPSRGRPRCGGEEDSEGSALRSERPRSDGENGQEACIDDVPRSVAGHRVRYSRACQC
jgi:hypothetical protein